MQKEGSKNELLLNCLCGGKPRWKYRKPFAIVVCRGCGRSTRRFADGYEEADSVTEAIEAWNRRASNDTGKSS